MVAGVAALARIASCHSLSVKTKLHKAARHAPWLLGLRWDGARWNWMDDLSHYYKVPGTGTLLRS